MHVRVELLGLARLAAGVREITLDLEEGTTFRDIVRTLGARYPKMIGNVIQPDGETLDIIGNKSVCPTRRKPDRIYKIYRIKTEK